MPLQLHQKRSLFQKFLGKASKTPVSKSGVRGGRSSGAHTSPTGGWKSIDVCLTVTCTSKTTKDGGLMEGTESEATQNSEDTSEVGSVHHETRSSTSSHIYSSANGAARSRYPQWKKQRHFKQNQDTHREYSQLSGAHPYHQDTKYVTSTSTSRSHDTRNCSDAYSDPNAEGNISILI